VGEAQDFGDALGVDQVRRIHLRTHGASLHLSADPSDVLSILQV
jgi:hypothetical protein